MSKKGKTLLKGHTLRFEGAPHNEEGKRMLTWAMTGRAKCSCGELSGPLPSKYARQRWHREHKDSLRGGPPVSEPEITDEMVDVDFSALKAAGDEFKRIVRGEGTVDVQPEPMSVYELGAWSIVTAYLKALPHSPLLAENKALKEENEKLLREIDEANETAEWYAERCKDKNRELNALPRCTWFIDTEMDDGPLRQVCTKPHGHPDDHRYAADYAAAPTQGENE